MQRMQALERPGDMRRLALVAAAILVAASLAVLPASTALACSCGIGTYEQTLAASDAALVGVVVDVNDSAVGVDSIVGGDVLEYTVSVDEPIKGRVTAGQQLEVRSARSGVSCGQEMAIGQRWRLMLHAEGDGFMTTLCSGNEMLAANVRTPSHAPDQPARLLDLPALLGAFGLLGAIVAFVLLRWIGAVGPR